MSRPSYFRNTLARTAALDLPLPRTGLRIWMQSTTIPLLDATIIDIYPSPSQQQQPSSQDTTMKQRGWKPFDSITNLTVSIPQPLSKPRLPSSTNQTDSAREGQRLRTRSNTGPSPARWRTKEFYAYYAIGVAAVFYMAKVTVDLSRGMLYLR